MKQKHEDIFIQAYDEYADAIFRFCAFRIGDRERAKELMQETFTRTWTYVRQGKHIENWQAFLYKVARNLTVNELLKRKPASLEEMQSMFGFDPTDTGESPERNAEIQMMLRELNLLESDYQEVLILRYINGLQVSEIAVLLDQEPNAVSVRIHRALKELRSKLSNP